MIVLFINTSSKDHRTQLENEGFRIIEGDSHSLQKQTITEEYSLVISMS